MIDAIDVVGDFTGSFHPGRTHWHTRYDKSSNIRFLFEELVDYIGRDMPLEYITIYNCYMAGCKRCWNS